MTGRAPRLTARRAACLAAGAALLTGSPVRAVLPPQYDSQLILVAAGTVTTLDPARASSMAEMDLVTALFEGLARVGPDGRPEPAAAAGWDPPADGLHWTFRLRPGVRFSDGSPVDAAACVASWRRAVREKPGLSRLFEGLNPVIVDSLTLRVDASGPGEDLPMRLTHPAASIVREVGSGAEASLRGSGPFRFAGMKEGGFVLAPRLDHHDGRPLPARVLVVAGDRVPAGTDTSATSPTAVLRHGPSGRLVSGPRVHSLRGRPSGFLPFALRLADIWVGP